MIRRARSSTATSTYPARSDADPAGAGGAARPAPAAETEGPEVPEAREPGDAWDLVHSAQQGDTSAFGRLYDRYVDVVFRYVLFRVGDRELAEDVTSETFLRALRRIGSVSYQGRDVGAWFVTIARNLVLDHVKSSRFRLEVATAEVDDSRRVEFGPEQQVISRVTTAALLECVEQLGDDQRECIVLRFLQGLSVAETAEVMRRNEGAVKALQHRAVRRLAQLLPSELR
jgi:RNA polymerase sigma-70 factor, ECF subfamily